MGSGVILLAIVGAWLAFLVPMGLRSAEQPDGTVLRPTERIGRAVRVVSRGTASTVAAARNEAAALRPAPSLTPLPVRRRRTLLWLLGLGLVSVGGGVFGPAWLVLVGVGFLLLSLVFAVHCRRQEVLRRGQRLRARGVAVVAARRAAAPHVSGIPLRMPTRIPLPEAVSTPRSEVVAARLARSAVAGLGEAWQPVPVPLPTYVGKAVAPATPRWTAPVDPEAELLDSLVDDRDLDVILERRRAVGGW